MNWQQRVKPLKKLFINTAEFTRLTSSKPQLTTQKCLAKSKTKAQIKPKPVGHIDATLKHKTRKKESSVLPSRALSLNF